jgi:hypothetical protein
LLTDYARVVIYNRHVFILQATDTRQSKIIFSLSKLAFMSLCFYS